ncbi:MAG: hypothetical protein WBC51_07965 [Vicinamibacterales bacterium]
MEPLLFVILPGIIGGIGLAFLFRRLGARQWGSSDYEHLEPPSTNIINMARIRVSGVGGLGMVAMSIVVAAFVPQIRMSMAIAFTLGIALALIMIGVRRRKGPLAPNPPGAHMMLPLDPVQKDGSKKPSGPSTHCDELPAPVPAR